MSSAFSRLQWLFFVLDAGFLYFAAYLGFRIRFPSEAWFHSVGIQSNVVVFVMILIYMFYLADMYSAGQRPSLVRRLNFSFTFGLIPLAFVAFLVPHLALGRGWFLLTYPIAMFLIFLWRRLIEPTYEKFMPRERVLIVGTGPNALNANDLLHKDNVARYDVAGFVPVKGNRLLVPNNEILNLEADLPSYAREHHISKIIVAADDRRGAFPIPELLECKMAGIDVLDVPTLIEMFQSKISLNIHSSALIFSHGFRRSRTAMTLKNTLDKVMAIIGLILTSPFFGVLPILIKLDSAGPVFFRQVRVGEHGKLFTIRKFRTMGQDAEAAGPQWASTDDPRITVLGTFLRKSRLDELPQMINVLEGTMSFVGPRPEVPAFVERLRHTLPYYDQRHVMKPGVTGWAQVKYRYGASAEDAAEKLQYDLYYIKHFSILLDILIIFETIRSVLLARGSR